MLLNSRSVIPCASSLRREISLRNCVFARSTLSWRNSGRGEQVLEDAQHLIGIFLKAIEGDRSRAFADGAFDRCRDVLQILIELVAGPGMRAARTQHVTGQPRKAVFVGGIEKIAGADQSRAADQRQFVIFEQEDLHAIGERNLGRLGNLESGAVAGISDLYRKAAPWRAALRFARSARMPAEPALEEAKAVSLPVSFRRGGLGGRRGVGDRARVGDQVLAGDALYIVGGYFGDFVDAGEEFSPIAIISVVERQRFGHAGVAVQPANQRRAHFGLDAVQRLVGDLFASSRAR